MKSESMAVESLVQKKRQALRFFAEELLSSDVRDSIAKIILFGSLRDGEVEEESDVDLFIVALNRLQQVAEACDEASLETALRFDESVQPLVGCIDEFRNSHQYFFRRVLKDHEEVYTMTEEEIRKGEAGNYLALAVEYLEQSRSNLELGNYRLIVDGGYNAAELCAKGLLILKGEDIPRRHGSTIQIFSKLYIKTEELPREIGRALNRSLRLRNRARYEYHAAITEREAKAALDLAEKMVKALEDKLAGVRT
ncbi:HEPN domain-containing protein [Candidatus Bipolaricaulota bacterium]|nr:HEPN domain-containing protein [Candidatus Bipolaricaulota bacterium]